MSSKKLSNNSFSPPYSYTNNSSPSPPSYSSNSTPLSPTITLTITSPTPSTLSLSPSLTSIPLSSSPSIKLLQPISTSTSTSTSSKNNPNNSNYSNYNSNNNKSNSNNNLRASIKNTSLSSSSSLSSFNYSDERSPGKIEINILDNTKQLSQRKLKVLGVNEDEMKRWPALKKLGLSDEDYHVGNKIFSEGNNSGKFLPPLTKIEKVTGYSTSQVKRTKAVNLLGTTEEHIVEERSRRLSTLGITQRSSNKTILPKLSERRRITVFG